MNPVIASLLILYGLISIYLGIRNSKTMLWVNIAYDWTKSLFGKDYIRINNLLWGAVTLIAGIALFFI